MPLVARVVRITQPGEDAALVPDDLVLRDPRGNEVLVEVVAAGLNRADILQRRGLYPAPEDRPPDVPGLEYAGVVAATGPAVQRWQPGQRVMGLVGGGAMSSHLLVPAAEVLPLPAGLSFEQAAAIPESFVTAWDALWVQARLAADEVVLLHAAGSGLGTAALQLARLRGACVAGTSRTPAKLERCAALGLQHGLLLAATGRGTPLRFAQALLTATGGRPADVIVDVLGAAALEDNLRALQVRGRLVVLGLLAGGTATLDLALLLRRRACLIGSVLRSRSAAERAALAAGFEREVLPHFESGALRPVIDAVLPMRDVAQAHRRMEDNATFGKLVLTW